MKDYRYTKWLDGNEVFNVPSRTWLLAYLLYKDVLRRVKGHGMNIWDQMLEDATHIMCEIGYVDESTITSTRPYGSIAVTYEDGS